MNLGQMQTKVRKIVGDRLASGVIEAQNDFIAGAINDVVIPDLVGRHDWFFKEAFELTALAQGVAEVPFTQTLQDVQFIQLLTGQLGTTVPLHFIPFKPFFEKYPDPTLNTHAYPCEYTWVNRKVYLDCPSNGNYQLRLLGLRRFPSLALDTDVPTWLDDDRHMMLVYGAAGFVYLTVEDSKNATIWFNLYEQGVESWWHQTENKGDNNAHLGRYNPFGQVRQAGEYWKQPFIMVDP